MGNDQGATSAAPAGPGGRGGAHDDGVRRRVLLYSHDTFGLGHLRRARAIAQALTEDDPGLAALIVTGSPIAGRFDFPDRVDHVRLPGVVKLADGGYATENLGLPLDETVALRAALIEAAEAAFRPDLLIVDKEATGFRNELLGTLSRARARGARLVLGLRDVLDAPEPLAREWARKGHVEAIRRWFDEIWVYGTPELHRPLEGVAPGPEVLRRLVYTGYLRREAPDRPEESAGEEGEAPYVLVTAGGGGDGAPLIDQALSAYEADPTLTPRAVIVYGPFLPHEARLDFERRAARLGERVRTLAFDARIERLQRDAVGIVAMGGYNTFCEILSLDRPAVIVPRTHPRLEQFIRAEAAERMGLMRMLSPGRDGAGPEAMARAIRGLATQPPPSAAMPAGLMDGLEAVAGRVRALLGETGGAGADGAGARVAAAGGAG